MKKMQGVIDPYTLGFLISIIGSMTAYLAHKDDVPSPVESKFEAKSTELVLIAPDKNDVIEDNQQ